MGSISNPTDKADPQTRNSSRGELRRGGHRVLADIRRQSRTQQQADAAERMMRYLSRCQRREGDEIRRTWRQLAKGLGLPTDGLTDRQCRNRYRSPIRRSLDYLISWGYVSAREALWEPSGEGRCILIVLPAGVAQSVIATGSEFSRPSSRPTKKAAVCGDARARSPRFFSEQVDTPSGGLQGVADSESLIGTREERRTTAGARARLGTRDRGLSGPRVGAALEAVTTADPEGGGRALVEARPELAGAPLSIVAREAWRLAGHPDGRLSSRGAVRLERAAAQLERCGYAGLEGPAASRAAILDLALGDWGDHWWQAHRRPDDRPPVTLGGLVFCLRHLARGLVNGGRVRRRARAEAARG